MVNVTIPYMCEISEEDREDWRSCCSNSEERGEELKKGYPGSEIERILHEDCMKGLI